MKKTIYNTLTENEQATILQYIHDRISKKEIDVDLLPRWLMSLHEEHLELQKLKEENRWIPVSERLPENCKRVLVRMSNFYTVVASYFNGSDDWKNDCGEYCSNVTHWQPLPQPPEET